MSYLNCKWKQHYIKKSAKIMQLPRIRFQKDVRAKSIDDIFEKTKLNSQRDETKEENNILRNSDRVMYNWQQYFEQWKEPKFRSVSVALIKHKLQYEYEEDITTIHNKCGIKVVNQAQQMHNKAQPQSNNLSDYEKQKQQVNEIFKSLYTSHQEKRLNIERIVSDRPQRMKPIDWNEVRRKLPKDQIGTIYDPTRFQNLYEKFNNEIEANVPHGPFISFRQFLKERRGHFKD
ncbi:unnamed protein product (macronuclear) [Paramecium tetraurelia]|uniref:Uncharacterized protein n=1 Tax=Paramecium tetraurelia TaxID=5888 RepID=A0DFI0_PARTE|nr:uncharacterized protein GSPATT00016610001 [Paramecium tetraurelia]CAK81797.1 unnamed protein product [Paramecium tetraurelia]|eukprot:XP_001449194.1 hypothetical protein (macronuclear) [Paramecium tetraurelia strain d4-2]